MSMITKIIMTISAQTDANNRGVSNNDQDYGCGYSTVDKMFDRQERRRCRRTDNTVWFQKPIIERKERSKREEYKLRIYRSYYKLLLFVLLYLLAWPLLCSSHLTSSFAQNPILAHAKNPTQRGNTMQSFSSLMYQNQQYVQDSDHNTDSEQQKEKQQKKEQQEQSDQEESEHPYNKYTWEMNQINPWLSACDLAGPAPIDLQGSCGAPSTEMSKYCPKLCKNPSERIKNYIKINKSFEDGSESGLHDNKCLLYLEESYKTIICQTIKENSKNNPSDLLRTLYLRNCCEYTVFNVLAPGKGRPLENVLRGDDECNDALDKLLFVDTLAARLYCKFEELLARYDCRQTYSVIYNCTHCKEAYRKWVCSSLMPYFAHRNPKDDQILEGSWTRLRPCPAYCQFVEQRCPYILPSDRAPANPTQYAGEPTFLCKDPNIPASGEQASKTLHSIDDECCFHLCSEDITDGICTTCKEPWLHSKIHESPTAQCKINHN